jgi:nucleoid DNA-binding protein
MVKNELLAKIAEKTTMTKVDVDKVLKAFEEVVTATLAEDKEEKITFGGLGSFKVKEVSERSGIIQMGDRKGQTYTTPAHEEITFKMSKSAKVLA